MLVHTLVMFQSDNGLAVGLPFQELNGLPPDPRSFFPPLYPILFMFPNFLNPFLLYLMAHTLLILLYIFVIFNYGNDLAVGLPQ